MRQVLFTAIVPLPDVVKDILAVLLVSHAKRMRIRRLKIAAFPKKSFFLHKYYNTVAVNEITTIHYLLFTSPRAAHIL